MLNYNYVRKWDILLTILWALLAQQMAQAHGRYILPSHTILSGKEPQTVSFTASISNDIFHPDMPLGDNTDAPVPAMLKGMFKQLKTSMILPDGKVSPQTWQAFKRFSASDASLSDNGTYRISMIQPPFLLTTFKHPNGERDRKFGPNPQLPEGAENIVRRQVSSRVDTFVSKNAPNRTAIESFSQGLELAGESHPNDLFVGEPVNFQLFFNGKALQQKVKIHLIREGTRHRNQRELQTIETDEQGQFNLTFEQAGFYWLEAEYSQKGVENSGIDWHHYSLYLTLEVFP